jgi:acyl-CoA synthetase (NDP forming)
MTSPITHEQLDTLFAPKSVALIGASDKSLFSWNAFGVMQRFGWGDRMYLVNPNKPQVHGTTTYASCADVPGGFDCAFIMLPQELVPQAIDDAAAVGARGAIVLTSGYAEVDDAGAAAQHALTEQCRRHGMILLGPNMLGFAHVGSGIAVCALEGQPSTPGKLALISQSGGLASMLTRFASSNGITFSYTVTTGNEGMVSAEDVLDYVLDDPQTTAVAVFAETIRNRELFLRAARKAARLGKAIVMLKAGTSELSARTAVAHTGALVGNDSVIDAVLRQEGVIRVDHMEELLITGHLAANTGPWMRPGIAVAAMSGGACDIVADRAEELGLPIPQLDPATENKLRGVISALGQAQNPLDVTGAGVIDRTLLGRITAILATDPQVGFVAVIGRGPDESLPGVGQALAEAAVPGALIAIVSQDLPGSTAEAIAAAGLFYLPSTRDAIIAMAKVSQWSTRLPQLQQRANSDPPTTASLSADLHPGNAMSEYEVRQLLQLAGVPVAPAALARTAAEAIAAANDFGGPVALKIVSATIEHKSDIGGVVLDVSGVEEVAAAFHKVFTCADNLEPANRVDGVLVSPMRSGGIELLAGVARDPDWGLVLAVGLGGLFVEVLDDAALLRLPAARDEIRRGLESLRGASILQGARGRPPANLDRVTDAIAAIADLALALGDDLSALEVNPLYVNGSVVEALDGLVNWRTR